MRAMARLAAAALWWWWGAAMVAAAGGVCTPALFEQTRHCQPLGTYLEMPGSYKLLEQLTIAVFSCSTQVDFSACGGEPKCVSFGGCGPILLPDQPRRFVVAIYRTGTDVIDVAFNYTHDGCLSGCSAAGACAFPAPGAEACDLPLFSVFRAHNFLDEGLPLSAALLEPPDACAAGSATQKRFQQRFFVDTFSYIFLDFLQPAGGGSWRLLDLTITFFPSFYIEDVPQLSADEGVLTVEVRNLPDVPCSSCAVYIEDTLLECPSCSKSQINCTTTYAAYTLPSVTVICGEIPKRISMGEAKIKSVQLLHPTTPLSTTIMSAEGGDVEVKMKNTGYYYTEAFYATQMLLDASGTEVAKRQLQLLRVTRTTLWVHIPPSDMIYRDFNFTVFLGDSDKLTMFMSYAQYQFTEIAPPTFPTLGGRAVLRGDFLGPIGTTVRTLLNFSYNTLLGSECDDARVTIPYKEIQCLMPSGYASPTMTVSVGDPSYAPQQQVSTGYPLLLSPIVSRFQPVSPFGSPSELTLRNPLPAGTALFVQFDCEQRFESCRLLEYATFLCTVPAENITCITSDGSHAYTLLYVLRGFENMGTMQVPGFHYYYAVPRISRVVLQGSRLYVVGENFRDFPVDVTIDGGEACKLGEIVLTRNYLYCQASRIFRGNKTVVLEFTEARMKCATAAYFPNTEAVAVTPGSLQPPSPPSSGWNTSTLQVNYTDSYTVVQVVFDEDFMHPSAAFYVSGTQLLTFATPPGVGTNHSLRVMFDETSALYFFSYDVYINAIESPNCTMLVATGSGFGTREINTVVLVLLGSTRRATILCEIIVPHQKISCPIPSGVGSRSAMLTVAPINVAFSPVTVPFDFSYPAPVIKSVEPAPTEGGYVTMECENIPEEALSSLVVQFDGHDCGYHLLEENTIEFYVPTASDLVVTHVVLVRTGGKTSDPWNFNYSAPHLESITKAHSNGGKVTIRGTSFGPSLGTVHVTIDGCDCPSATISVPHSEITCNVRASVGRNLAVFVEAAHGSALRSNFFNYYDPVIYNVTSTPTYGGVATVRGTDFGNKNNISVFIDGVACPVVAFTFQQSVSFSTPPGVGSATVSIAVAKSIFVAHPFVYQGPVVSSVSSVGTKGGFIVIAGMNFGNWADKITVLLGGSPCTQVTLIAAELELQCLVPPGSGTKSVVVTVAGQQAVGPNFVFEAPVVFTATTPPACGGLIRINGSNFGTQAADVEVRIAGNPCKNVSIVQNHAQLQCTAPPGSGVNQNVAVAVSGLRSSNNVLSYAGPVVFNCTPGPSEGGIVNCTGDNFAEQGNKNVIVSIDNQPCTEAVVIQPFTEIMCHSPAGTGRSKLIEIEVRGQQYFSFSFDYQAPVCTDATSVDFNGGITYISGRNFGVNSTSVVVQVGSTFCSHVEMVTAHQQLSCSLGPSETTAPLPVVVTVDGQRSPPCTLTYRDFTPPHCMLYLPTAENVTFSDSATVVLNCSEPVYGVVQTAFVVGVDCAMSGQPQQQSSSGTTWLVPVILRTGVQLANCSISLKNNTLTNKHKTPNPDPSNTVVVLLEHPVSTDEGKSSKMVIIAVAVPVVVVFVLFVGLIAVVLFIFSARRASQSGEVIELDVFQQLKYENVEDINASKVELSDFPLTVSLARLSFGGSTQIPVDEHVTEKFTVTNPTEDVYTFRLVPHRTQKYWLAFVPTTATVTPDSEVVVTAHLRALCTTTVDALVTFAAARGHDSPTASQTTTAEDGQLLQPCCCCCAMPLRLQSQLSTKLDPDEIELAKPAIAEGAFGIVYRGNWRSQDVAVKVFKNQDLDHVVEDFDKEVSVMESLRNPYVIHFVGAVHISSQLAILTEYMPLGNLVNAMQHFSFSLALKLKCLLNCAQGMSFLHSCGIIHRDLKGENLLMSSLDPQHTVNCKLTDFGTTKGVQHSDIGLQATNAIGTQTFMAPEVLTSGTYSTFSDVYSFAILAVSVWEEKDPFREFTTSWQISEFVVGGQVSFTRTKCVHIFLFRGQRFLLPRQSVCHTSLTAAGANLQMIDPVLWM
eukprot:TRINITY_DN2919_c1_g1_i1.p1 TRINITY_DN2919_c1_g1~~TRINITY_DN2919_c1_g1_i1.p1  ORF type:complete len:2023 (-),score=255.78 TRINITY_DN2919_c1_g1_i1:109-6177(-)